MDFIKNNNVYKVYDVCWNLHDKEVMRCLGKIKYIKFFKCYGFHPSFLLQSIGIIGMLKISNFIKKLENNND